MTIVLFVSKVELENFAALCGQGIAVHFDLHFIHG